MKRATICGMLALAALVGSARGQFVWAQAAPDNKQEIVNKPAAPPVSAAPVTTAPDIDPALRAQVAALVDKLSSGAYAEREAAATDLRALGMKAIPLLKETIEANKDPEVKSRLTGVANDLAEVEALTPTLITLDLQNASLKDLFAAISKQTTFPVVGWPDWYMDDRNHNNNVKPITIKVDHQPFWLVMADIAKQQPMAPMGGDQGNRVQLQIGADNLKLGPHVINGPIVLSAKTIVRHYETRLAEKPEDSQVQKSFNISFMYLIDPKANVMREGGKIALEKAEDEKGNSLLPSGLKPKLGAEPVFSTGLNMWGLTGEQSIPLTYPDNPGTRLTVKGTMTVEVETLTDTMDFKNFEDTGGPHGFGGMQLTITDISKHGDNYTVEVKCERGTLSQDQWQKMMNFGNNRLLRVDMIDDQGQPMSSQGGGGGSNGTTMTHSYNFSGRDFQNNNKKFGDPKIVRISVTAKTKMLDIPFEFKDLPLP